MIKAELKYEYSTLDKTHCYYLPAALDGFDTWRWFYLGKYLKVKEKGDFRLYPFHPYNDDAKTILICKVSSASKQGSMLANKINEHYLKRVKSRKNPAQWGNVEGKDINKMWK